MKTETLKSIIDVIDNDEQWDNRELGADENSVKAVALNATQQQVIDESVGLQLISIRLPKSLIDEFKFLGDVHSLKYQTLMRQILVRFAESESKRIANNALKAQLKVNNEKPEVKSYITNRQNRKKTA